MDNVQYNNSSQELNNENGSLIPGPFASGIEKVLVVDSSTKVLEQPVNFISVTYTTTGAVTITLPPALTSFNTTSNNGYIYTIADVGANAGTNKITIQVSGSDTIISDTVGNSNVEIINNGDVLTLQCINTTTWKVL